MYLAEFKLLKGHRGETRSGLKHGNPACAKPRRTQEEAGFGPRAVAAKLRFDLQYAGSMTEQAPTVLRSRWRRPVLAALAFIFAAVTLLYSGLWMATVRLGSEQFSVELGYDYDYLVSERAQLIKSVMKNSPADRAGLRPGDRIIGANGARIQDVHSLDAVWRRSKQGDTVQLTIERAGQATPMLLTARFRQRSPGRGGLTFALQILSTYPVPFVLVGLTVLFLRLEDPHAWLLALLFGIFPATPGFPNGLAAVPSALQPFMIAYQDVSVGMLGAIFYFFFAVFPSRSPLDRRLPWLKWAALPVSICFVFPGLRGDGLRAPWPVPMLLGDTVAQNIAVTYVLGLLALGVISLAANYRSTPDLEARRKIRMIVWGTVTGVTPGVVQAAATNFAGLQAPLWLQASIVLVSFLMPLSFAYAVVKHRVLDIPVLLKRSARYVLVQRGFTILLSLVSIALTLLFALSFPRYLQAATEVTQPTGIFLGTVLGTVLFWGGSQVQKRVSGKIDRAFFRSAYDARVILEDLAEKTRTVTNRAELAQLLDRHLGEALQPSFLVIYLQASEDRLSAVSGVAPPGLETVSTKLPILAELAKRGTPWELPQGGENGSPLGPLHADCMVPILGHSGHLVGLLVLGARLSEEPYSREDKRLLASVAGQAGTVLENIRLAEEIAQRMETERRTAREMEIAKEVQSRLLPQATPILRTLGCAAQCIQTRSVGGDYYDFLDLGPGRVGLVLADVSGKGVHAALLVANLQAHLSSQSGVLAVDPVRSLQYVNHMLWKSTAAEHYATLFFGMYDDSTRHLDYVNCGHNPPVLLRREGGVERLTATALVIGLFDKWDCSVGHVQLGPGDLLAIFSDGITEAARGEEEFGEARFIDELRSGIGRSETDLVTTILASVQQFSAGNQSDDLTLLIARGLPVIA